MPPAEVAGQLISSLLKVSDSYFSNPADGSRWFVKIQPNKGRQFSIFPCRDPTVSRRRRPKCEAVLLATRSPICPQTQYSELSTKRPLAHNFLSPVTLY